MRRACWLAVSIATGCNRSAPPPVLGEPANVVQPPGPVTKPAAPKPAAPIADAQAVSASSSAAPPPPLEQAGIDSEAIWIRISRERIDTAGGWRCELVDGNAPSPKSGEATTDVRLTNELTRLLEQAREPHRERIILFVTSDIVFETLVIVMSAAKSAGFSNYSTFAIRENGELER